MNRIIPLLAAAAAIPVAAWAQTLMPQSEVETALRGATFALTTQGGDTATITFHPDMTAEVTMVDGSKDHGTYRFAEGGYCSSWEDFRNGAEACFTVEKISDSEFQLYTPDGRKDDRFVRQ